MSGQRHVLVVGTVEGAASGADTKYLRWPEGFPSLYIETIDRLPDDAITANDTDYTTAVLTNDTDSVTLHTGTTQVTGGVAMVAGTALEVDLSALTAAQRTISPGDVLKATKADTGAGKAGSWRYVIGCSEIRS